MIDPALPEIAVTAPAKLHHAVGHDRLRPQGVLPTAIHGRGERTWAITIDTPVHARAAWNAGKTVGTKRPLTQKQIWAIRFFLDREGRLRDRALFDLAIDSKLRGCELVRIAIGDVVAGADMRTRAVVVQKKTGRPVQFELTADVRASLIAWLERRGGTVADYLFPSRVDHTTHMSTRQYARLLGACRVNPLARERVTLTHRREDFLGLCSVAPHTPPEPSILPRPKVAVRRSLTVRSRSTSAPRSETAHR